MKKVYVETYGCTLNHADSDIMRALLLDGHYELSSSKDKNDIVILNTCTVKGVADNKIMERIRGLAKANRKFVVAGCLSVNASRIRKIAPTAPIITPSSVRHICDAVEDAFADRASFYNIRTRGNKESLPRLLTAPIMRVPISEGCTSSCNFCQTKLARPLLQSATPKSIVRTIEDGLKLGAKEVQLTSMDCGAYGLDIKTDLVALLNLISNSDAVTKKSANSSSANLSSANSFRIRVGMANPDHFKRMMPRLLDAFKHDCFYKFFHIPVQSGSEKVCSDMNRDHSVGDFIELATTIRATYPDASISTDIIVGYPTEGEDEFNETLELVEKIKPEVVNISRFSPRPGTKAKNLKPLSDGLIKKRTAALKTLVDKVGREQRLRFVGTVQRVLITEHKHDFTGRDQNYNQVIVKGFKGKPGDFVDVEIIDATSGYLFGTIVRK